MQWKLTKSELPQTTKPISWYLVNTPEGVGFTEFSPVNGFSNVVIIDNRQLTNIEITHWMDLPEPPKE